MIGFILRLAGGSKLIVWAGAALAIVAIVGGAFLAGINHNDAKRDREALEATLQTGDRIDEAISDGVGLPWLERLLGE